jgi:hypothetical protein
MGDQIRHGRMNVNEKLGGTSQEAVVKYFTAPSQNFLAGIQIREPLWIGIEVPQPESNLMSSKLEPNAYCRANSVGMRGCSPLHVVFMA